jgi:hypothetical protein
MTRRQLALFGLLLCCSSSFLPLVRGDSSDPSTDPAFLSSENLVQFDFTYAFDVTDIPDDATSLRVWMPRPVDDAVQAVQLRSLSAPAAVRFTEDQTHGNGLIYCQVALPADQPLHFAATWRVTRGQFVSPQLADSTDDAARYLGANAMVPVDGFIKQFATDIGRDEDAVPMRGRALYDYCLDYMRYDKSGAGWGQGSVQWACDARYGNCTDFHSLFIALSRVRDIPAKFEIGFPLSHNASSGNIGGYHCWAKFHDDATGWWAVDISEADKRPSLTDYFFGRLDARRVHFTTGRDLLLEPAQDGPPLNFLIYPYVEVDGQIHQSIDKRFRYDNLTAVD